MSVHLSGHARVLLLQGEGPIILRGFIQIIIVFLVVLFFKFCAQNCHNSDLHPLRGKHLSDFCGVFWGG